MDKPLRFGALMSSKTYDIDAITNDPEQIRAILSQYVYDAIERGTRLPENWTLDVTVNLIVNTRYSDERALCIEGVVIPA